MAEKRTAPTTEENYPEVELVLLGIFSQGKNNMVATALNEVITYIMDTREEWDEMEAYIQKSAASCLSDVFLTMAKKISFLSY